LGLHCGRRSGRRDALLHRRQHTAHSGRQPGAGRERGELAASLRSFPVGNYIVFCLPLPDGINVVRILDGYLDITPRTWASSVVTTVGWAGDSSKTLQLPALRG
jgi:hypothetical protein